MVLLNYQNSKCCYQILNCFILRVYYYYYYYYYYNCHHQHLLLLLL